MEEYLSDATGAMLVSLPLQRSGLSIRYQPALQIEHATHPLGSIINQWHRELAHNAIAIKLAALSLPGAHLVWLGPLAAGARAASRFWQDVRRVAPTRRQLQVSLHEFFLYCCLLAGLTPVYFFGLCRETWFERDRIAQEI